MGRSNVIGSIRLKKALACRQGYYGTLKNQVDGAQHITIQNSKIKYFEKVIKEQGLGVKKQSQQYPYFLRVPVQRVNGSMLYYSAKRRSSMPKFDTPDYCRCIMEEKQEGDDHSEGFGEFEIIMEDLSEPQRAILSGNTYALRRLSFHSEREVEDLTLYMFYPDIGALFALCQGAF